MNQKIFKWKKLFLKERGEESKSVHLESTDLFFEVSISSPRLPLIWTTVPACYWSSCSQVWPEHHLLQGSQWDLFKCPSNQVYGRMGYPRTRGHPGTRRHFRDKDLNEAGGPWTEQNFTETQDLYLMALHGLSAKSKPLSMAHKALCDVGLGSLHLRTPTQNPGMPWAHSPEPASVSPILILHHFIQPSGVSCRVP